MAAAISLRMSCKIAVDVGLAVRADQPLGSADPRGRDGMLAGEGVVTRHIERQVRRAKTVAGSLVRLERALLGPQFGFRMGGEEGRRRQAFQVDPAEGALRVGQRQLVERLRPGVANQRVPSGLDRVRQHRDLRRGLAHRWSHCAIACRGPPSGDVASGELEDPLDLERRPEVVACDIWALQTLTIAPELLDDRRRLHRIHPEVRDRDPSSARPVVDGEGL